MLRVSVFFSCMLVLVGCSTEGEIRRAEYLDADYLTRLELPPDLIFEGGSAILKIPVPTKQAMQKFQAGLKEDDTGKAADSSKDLSQLVVPSFDGLRLQSEGGLYWLEIDQSGDDIWPLLQAFWEHEGVKLSRIESMIGLMETEWLSRYQVDEDDGFLRNCLPRLIKTRVIVSG